MRTKTILHSSTIRSWTKVPPVDMQPGSVWVHTEFDIGAEDLIPVAVFVVLDDDCNCLYLREDYESKQGSVVSWWSMHKSSWDSYKRIV